MKEAVREFHQRGQEVFIPLVHRPGEARVDFGEALVRLGGQAVARTTQCADFLLRSISCDASVDLFHLDPRVPILRADPFQSEHLVAAIFVHRADTV